MRTSGSFAARERTGLRRKLDDALAAARVAQDPQPGAGHAAKRLVAVLGDQVVLVVAEEREVVLDDPLEQRLRLGQLLGVDGRRVGVQVGDHLAGPLGHGPPVLDRGAHVSQDVLEARLHGGQVLGVGLADDLGVEERLEGAVGGLGVVAQDLEELPVLVPTHPDDRVDDQVDAAAELRQLHAHRVDQERHVGVDDLDHRVGRRPPVLFQLRGVDAHLRLAGLPPRREVEVGERGAVEVDDAALQQVVGRYGAVVDADEGLEPRRLLRGELGVGVLDGSLDQTGLRLVGLRAHGLTQQSVRPGAVCRTATPRR